MEALQPARHAVTSACRGFVRVARVGTASLFFPLLILFLKLIHPGALITGALKVPGQTVFVIIIIISLVAAVDSFLSIVAGYRRLTGFPWGPFLLFVAGAMNIITACHWLIMPPLIP